MERGLRHIHRNSKTAAVPSKEPIPKGRRLGLLGIHLGSENQAGTDASRS